MNSDEKGKASRRRLLWLLCSWVAGTLALYLLHFCLGWYHAGTALHYLICAVFGLPVFGIACACPILIGWLWTTQVSSLRKVCFTVLTISIAVPVVCAAGFLWALLHMAP